MSKLTERDMDAVEKRIVDRVMGMNVSALSSNLKRILSPRSVIGKQKDANGGGGVRAGAVMSNARMPSAVLDHPRLTVSTSALTESRANFALLE